MKTFVIQYNMFTRLTEQEIWPDGDGPEDPSCEDVKKAIDKAGGILKVIGDWNLDEYRPEYDVDIWPTPPEWKGDGI